MAQKSDWLPDKEVGSRVAGLGIGALSSLPKIQSETTSDKQANPKHAKAAYFRWPIPAIMLACQNLFVQGLCSKIPEILDQLGFYLKPIRSQLAYHFVLAQSSWLITNNLIRNLGLALSQGLAHTQAFLRDAEDQISCP